MKEEVMHRLLVLSSLAVAIVTVPALATAANPSTTDQDIGSAIAGQDDGTRAADYWTPSRRATATDLSVLVLPGDGDPALTL
jgi:hypothetical protein